MSRQAWATPTPPAAAESRVWLSEPNTMRVPSPGWPRMFSLGTLTSFRAISPVGEEWEPSLSMSAVLTPSRFLGSITNADRPLLPWERSE